MAAKSDCMLILHRIDSLPNVVIIIEPSSENLTMPRVAFFFGISIYMYMDDHGIPHCHAMYGDFAGSFSLEDGEPLAGEMPPAQAKKIKIFILNNQVELLEKWHELSD
ncbi:hypothetical protein CEP10_09790 [Cylindrospermopsis raciborskii S07]|nr:DUF4160 domain-containing protein [Cylindrospermopsis raciborskii]EFA69581.1 hypothetical protein CRC_01845 [Cylindrospermopsis raciborskii CS-505]PNJ90426.1 hypothetical protein CEP15_19485 [Cylindrospermopsis raciborskii C07]PNJ92246.1 hypothetical protein CEP14_15335 [Cylindrospermopsis raciborskii C04]PNK01735.1 hypothetical protein CEP11_16540 [Cylindrospermopsis raciborskii S10]PNK05576.1 hypothetical protein CEP12_10870 [Cylindrospermopsis raciborskii S14]PNK12570.1 hypothetical pro